MARRDRFDNEERRSYEDTAGVEQTPVASNEVDIASNEQPVVASVTAASDANAAAAVTRDVGANQRVQPTASGITGAYTAGDNTGDWYAQSKAYQSQADKMLEEWQKNGSTFQYDFNTDPLFKSLKASYDKQAQKAAADASILAATRTGGYGNSYGAGMASQAYNDSIADLYANVPDLEQIAYGRYRDQLGDQWNAMNRMYSNANDQYLRESNAESNAYQYAAALASMGDFGRLGEFLGMDLSDLQNDYNFKNDLEKALNSGDLSFLEPYGIDTAYLNWQLNSPKALAGAQFRDYTGLNNLDINTDDYEAYLQWQQDMASQEMQLNSLYNSLSVAMTAGDIDAANDIRRQISAILGIAYTGDITDMNEIGYSGGSGGSSGGSGSSSGSSGGSSRSYGGSSTSYSGGYSGGGSGSGGTQNTSNSSAQKEYDDLSEGDKYIVNMLKSGYDPKWVLSK